MIAFRRHLDEASIADVADLGTHDHLAPAERLHLDSCDRCRGLVTGHRRTSRLLSASWRLVPAAELVGSGVTAVRPRVRIGSALRTSDSRTRASWLRLAVVLGAALLLVVTGLLVASSRRPLPTATRLTFSLPMFEEAGLISVNTDGSGVQSIALEDGCCLWDPTWSPDGGQLAFARTGFDQAQLVIVAADSPAEPRVVGDIVPQLYGDFEWSPDGSLLAGWDDRGLVVADAETGERLWTLPLQPGRGVQLSWSPDGSRILLTLLHSYVSGHGGEDLVVLHVATGQETFRYHAEPGNHVLVSHGAWSPDGTLFVFYTGRDWNPSDIGPLVDTRILVMGQDGGPPRELAAGRNPTWSPDGAFIAFERTGFGLSVIRPDGSGLRSIGGGRPSWSPDGRQLAYCGDNERNGWYVADALGWEPRLVYETACFDTYDAGAAWQPTQQGD